MERPETDEIDALALRLRPHYGRFLAHLGEQILLTGHSHQAWPDVSREGQIAAWDDAARLVDRKWGQVLGDMLPEFQRRVAQRIGTTRPADIAIACSTHELVYRLASCFPLQATVLTTDSEFHSLRRQLDRLAEAGTIIRRMAVGDGEDFNLCFIAEAERLHPAWAALSCVLYATSRVITDLPHVLCEFAGMGIPLLVDAYHAFNVMDLQVDRWPGTVFVTGGGYKYAQCGEGICWMLLPQDAERFRPRNTGWFSDFDSLDSDDRVVRYGRGGMRFMGATFDPTSLYRAVYVLRWMDAMGLSPAVLRAQSLRQTSLILRCYDELGLEAQGLGLATPRPAEERGGFISLSTPRARDIADALGRAGVHTDVRGSLLRLGPAPYTTSEEIVRAMELLASCVPT